MSMIWFMRLNDLVFEILDGYVWLGYFCLGWRLRCIHDVVRVGVSETADERVILSAYQVGGWRWFGLLTREYLVNLLVWPFLKTAPWRSLN